MSVYCQQIVNGDETMDQWVEPHFVGQTDEELLLAKEQGARDKDWDVEWLTPTSFVARKVRWQPDALCERVFRVG